MGNMLRCKILLTHFLRKPVYQKDDLDTHVRKACNVSFPVFALVIFWFGSVRLALLS